MSATSEKDKKNLETELWNAISAFEQMLEAMPNDRVSLEALSHAYEQIGDHTKSVDYLIRLGNVLIDDGDNGGASAIIEKLGVMAPDDKRTKDLIKRLESSGSSKQHVGDSVATGAQVRIAQEKQAANVRMTFNMADELSFTWSLMEANELTQEEYASVVQDLTEMSASDSNVTISVLHVLESRGFKGIDRIIAYLSRQCKTPFVSLACFEFQFNTANLLPLDFCIKRGAFAFESVGKTLLVTVMNPFDKQLQKDVETLAKRRCSFYITYPSEFDRTVAKYGEVLIEKAAAAAEAAAEAKA